MKKKETELTSFRPETPLTEEERQALILSEKLKILFQQTGETSLKYNTGRNIFEIWVDENNKILVDGKDYFFPASLIIKYLNDTSNLMNFLRDKKDIFRATKCNAEGNGDDGEYLKFNFPQSTISIILHQTKPILKATDNKILFVPSQEHIEKISDYSKKIENCLAFDELYNLTKDNKAGFLHFKTENKWIKFGFVDEDDRLFYEYAINSVDKKLVYCVLLEPKLPTDHSQNNWKDCVNSCVDVLKKVQKNQKGTSVKLMEVTPEEKEAFRELLTLVSSRPEISSDNFQLNFDVKDEKDVKDKEEKQSKIIINESLEMVFKYNRSGNPKQISAIEALNLYKKNFVDIEEKNVPVKENQNPSPSPSPKSDSSLISKLPVNQNQPTIS